MGTPTRTGSSDGVSGGGHMTNMVITFTDRSKPPPQAPGGEMGLDVPQSDMRRFARPGSGNTVAEGCAVRCLLGELPLKYASRVKTHHFPGRCE